MSHDEVLKYLSMRKSKRNWLRLKREGLQAAKEDRVYSGYGPWQSGFASTDTHVHTYGWDVAVLDDRFKLQVLSCLYLYSESVTPTYLNMYVST